MTSIKNLYKLVLVMLLFTSCNDSFFDTAPTTSITDDSYWVTAEDFRLYLNGLYPTMFTGHSSQWTSSPIVYGDHQSDNMVAITANIVAAGEYIVPSTGGGYDFAVIRKLNILLDNAKTTPLVASKLAPYVGEAKLFKALTYSGKVRLFGDYPWLSTEINLDSPELYADRTPRKVVMDSVLADINYAIETLPENTDNASYVNRNVALAAKARIFLYEGTHMKYYGSGDATEYLQEAFDAAEELINSGDYSLQADYKTLFSQQDKSTSSEAIFIKDYEHEMVTTATQRTIELNGPGTGVSKSLVDSYLDLDGKPISQSATYDESEGWLTEFNNRDPRLAATVSSPDSDLLLGSNPPIKGASEDEFDSYYGVTTTGYYLEKHWERNEEEYNLAQSAAYDAIIYRYGEILLIYAEAAYELGTLDQAKLDRSINLLRDRVGMPHMVIGEMVKDADSDFPEIDVVLDEIRRERRVELAIENFRYDDLIRWNHGEVLAKKMRGMKFLQSMYPSIDLTDAATELQVDSDGYIWPYAESHPNGRVFEAPKHYLFPLPADELVLNPILTQNEGW